MNFYFYLIKFYKGLNCGHRGRELVNRYRKDQIMVVSVCMLQNVQDEESRTELISGERDSRQ